MLGRPSSSSPLGDRILWAAVLVIGALSLSALASGHALISLIRLAWTPLIIGAVLLLSLWPGPIRSGLSWLVSAGVLVAGGDTLYQRLWGHDLFGFPSWAGRLPGPLPHPNDTALWACLLPFTPLWLWPVSGMLIFASYSRTAMLGALVVAVLLAPRRWRWGLGLAVGALFAYLVMGWSQLVHGGQTDGTARVGMWLVGWEMFRQAPWVGQGPARFVDFYLPVLAQLGPHPWGTHAEWAFIPWAHNLYVEVLAELGVVGLVAMALPLVWVWRQGCPRVRAALTAFLVMGLVDLTFLKPWVVGVYWGMCLVALAPGDGGRVL